MQLPCAPFDVDMTVAQRPPPRPFRATPTPARGSHTDEKDLRPRSRGAARRAPRRPPSAQRPPPGSRRQGEHHRRREGGAEAVAGHLHAVRVLRPERLLQRLRSATATTRCPPPARAAPPARATSSSTSARPGSASRLAFNDTAGWTKATLSALVEVDFQGGYTGAVPTISVAFYNPVIRLRKAYADAAWGRSRSSRCASARTTTSSRCSARSRLAYVANPLFQFAGTLNGRAPMIEVRYDLNPKDGIAVNAQVAAVNPQDNTAGDAHHRPSPRRGRRPRRRQPLARPRLRGARRPSACKTGGKKVAELAGWGGWQKNRFVSPATDTNVDVNSYIYRRRPDPEPLDGPSPRLDLQRQGLGPARLARREPGHRPLRHPRPTPTTPCDHHRTPTPFPRSAAGSRSSSARTTSSRSTAAGAARRARSTPTRARLLAVERHPRPELPVGGRPHRLRRQELALLGGVLPRHQLLLHGQQLLPGPVLPQLAARLLAAAIAAS